MKYAARINGPLSAALNSPESTVLEVLFHTDAEIAPVRRGRLCAQG